MTAKIQCPASGKKIGTRRGEYSACEHCRKFVENRNGKVAAHTVYARGRALVVAASK
jgi:hypothetical protein